MTDDNTELVGVSARPLMTAASARATGETPTSERIRLFWTDQRESLLVALHILRIVGKLAWRKQIPRRRISYWARAFFGAWFSQRLRRMAPDSGFCFRARAPRRAISDQEGSSMLLLVENGAPLPAPHTAHDEIRHLGRGRYSHWGRYIYFSSSDNTDPRRNGRVYKLVRRI